MYNNKVMFVVDILCVTYSSCDKRNKCMILVLFYLSEEAEHLVIAAQVE